MKVAYLGPEGTYTEELTKRLFPSADRNPLKSPLRIVWAIERDDAQYGIVPGENIYGGGVEDTLDALTILGKETRIIGESSKDIHHCIGALPGHSRIEQILSHKQALSQCVRYVLKHYPEADMRHEESTAEAAKKIAEQGLKNAAAIASRSALEKYGLKVLEEEICPNNRTRFFVLGKEMTQPTGKDKTFLAIHPPMRDKPGILADIVNPLATLNINQEFIVSRADGKGKYYFYTELDGHEEDERVAIALKAIKLSLDPKRAHPDTIKVLGSYANSDWKNAN